MPIPNFDSPFDNGTVVYANGRPGEIRGNQQLEQPTSYLVLFTDEAAGNSWISADQVSTTAPSA